MNKRYTSCLISGILIVFVSFLTGFAQVTGDNTPDPMVNLGCLDAAVLSGSVPSGRGIPSDILWNPATNSFKSDSPWHEYGLAYDSTAGGVTKDNPMYWQVMWPTAKNINFITCKGPYSNQPQPHTGWAIQTYDAATESWTDLAKAHDGWDADSLRGVGGWVSDGYLIWKGVEPVVTTGIRFTAYANPDSLADTDTTFADSLWSMVFVGGSKDAVNPGAALIQYLDFSGETAKNRKDEMVNLALLDGAVVSSKLTPANHPGHRGEPADLLWNPKTGDFHNNFTSWGEFGYDYNYHAGVVPYDSAFYWQVEWAVPVNINYFTWGGAYTNQPEPDTYWAVEYWSDGAWVELASGIGTDRSAGTYLYDSNGNVYDFNGIGVDSLTNSTWQSEVPIQTTKFRLAVWDPDFDLWSYSMRGRGGATKNWDETEWVRDYEPGNSNGADPIPSTFKALLVQYRNPPVSAIESADLVGPSEFTLYQNYPNPFNPTTSIKFNVEKMGHVSLFVYNVKGQEVAELVNGTRPRGSYQVAFDASALSSGVYYYQLKTNQGVLSKKMVLIK